MQVSFGNDFLFQLDTMLFDELQKQSPQRFSTHERVGQRPVLQNLGPGTDTLSLPGVMFDSWLGKDGMGSINDLYAIKEKADPQELWTLGEDRFTAKSQRVWNGYYYINVGYGLFGERYLPGRWVISDITETQKHFYGSARPRQIDWVLALSRYD